MFHTPPSSRPILIVLNYRIISIILPETPPYIFAFWSEKVRFGSNSPAICGVDRNTCVSLRQIKL